MGPTRSRFPRRVRTPAFGDVSNRTMVSLEWSWLGAWSEFLHHTDITLNSFTFLQRSVCTENATLDDKVAESSTAVYTYVVPWLICCCSAWSRSRSALQQECSITVSTCCLQLMVDIPMRIWPLGLVIEGHGLAEKSTTRKLMPPKLFFPCGRASHLQVFTASASFRLEGAHPGTPQVLGCSLLRSASLPSTFVKKNDDDYIDDGKNLY